MLKALFLTFLAMLVCISPTHADVRDFGEYSVDVPAGWRVLEEGGGQRGSVGADKARYGAQF